MARPLEGAFYVKNWTNDRKCADYETVRITGNLTDDCVGLEDDQCACNLRWADDQTCGAPQTRWATDGALTGWAADALTVIPDRTCACAAGCSASRVPFEASVNSTAPSCFVDAHRSRQIELRPGNWFTGGAFGQQCFANPCFRDADELKKCLNPCRTSQKPNAFYLLGDSHAAAWLAGVRAAAQSRYGVVHASCGHGCGVHSLDFHEKFFAHPDTTLERDADECYAFVEALRVVLSDQLRPGDVVSLITANYKYDLVGHYDAELIEELTALVASKGATLVVLGDGPLLKEFGFQCATPGRDAEACATPYDDAAGALRQSAEAAFREAGALVFNQTLDLLCRDGICDHRVPGTDTVGIVDTGHFTTEGSLYLAPFLACFLERAGLL